MSGDLSQMRAITQSLKEMTRQLSPLPAALTMSGAITDFEDLSQVVFQTREEVQQLRGLIPEVEVQGFEQILDDVIPTLRTLLVAMMADDRQFYQAEPSLLVRLNEDGAKSLKLSPNKNAGVSDFLDNHAAAGEIFLIDSSLSLLKKFVSENFRLERTTEFLVQYLGYVANAIFRIESANNLLQGVFGAAETLAGQQPNAQPKHSIFNALLGDDNLTLCSNPPQFAKAMLQELSTGEHLRQVLVNNLGRCQDQIQALRDLAKELPGYLYQEAALPVQKLPMMKKLVSAEFVEAWRLFLEQGEILEPQSSRLRLILES